ncbi:MULTISPECIES: ABC transporter permease [Rhodobacterales]|jgi:simple sugar transport system permease protein|uniref:ABC transporter permease n=1 Tax=Rhodobacterales TaxID=204455 RepID=UPI00237F34C0|nr:ABC transporter permease [Phaeobacter gallaeciensis]MDE4140461.1 ABC transporter permease [Phaeobacter gallaeciensis]MDE4148846.1 ABC transporter permease [Phaeobacter gallaeciensis]MDE4153068.1 ABC transporter permease [Phaeobacter gallaeciensis]MDE4228518.1 ABC transporter permease [Phaeobacter gallaeciensis]MDE4257594.1 ABC transporter permease [Phaeobacter gallaeciensis]
MRLEPIAAPSLARRVLPPALAIAATFVVAALLAMIAGGNPFAVFGLILKGAFGSKFAILETLNSATPLIFTGLAIAVAFRAKLWNIGAEAQLYAGAVITVVLGTGALSLPAPLMLALCAIAAMLAGALILLGPALLKTRLGVDEVVTTLLLNFIFLLFVSYLLEGPLKDPMGMGWPKSARLLPEARLPRIVEGLRLHWGFALALIAALGVWVINTRTTLGYEMRAVGQNAEAAGFAGIPVTKVILKTALLSGGLAGLAGFSEVSGLKGSLTLDLSPGFGYTGIVVAMLALLHPLGVVVAALFVAAIFVGADSMSRAAGVPSYLADIMLASALLFMVLAILLTKFRLRRD